MHEFADQCDECDCPTCLDMGHLLCASMGCVNHYTAPFQAIREMRDFHTQLARTSERAECIRTLIGLVQPLTLRNCLGRFNPPLNAGLRVAISALNTRSIPPLPTTTPKEQKHGLRSVSTPDQRPGTDR